MHCIVSIVVHNAETPMCILTLLLRRMRQQFCHMCTLPGVNSLGVHSAQSRAQRNRRAGMLKRMRQGLWPGQQAEATASTT